MFRNTSNPLQYLSLNGMRSLQRGCVHAHPARCTKNAHLTILMHSSRGVFRRSDVFELKASAPSAEEVTALLEGSNGEAGNAKYVLHCRTIALFAG